MSSMPLEAPTEERPETASASEDAELRKLALSHVEHVRKLKLYVFAYVLSLAVLTPIWIVTQYETSPGWLKHLSSRSRYPGDWDPWLIWVALIGAAVVAIAAYRVHVDRSERPHAIEREIERLKATHS
jgi:hypothetical protein